MKFIIGFKENAILKNGIELEYSDDNVNEFKALNEIDKNLNARDVCPIQELCDYNNCFDCDVYGMFSGCCFYNTS